MRRQSYGTIQNLHTLNMILLRAWEGHHPLSATQMLASMQDLILSRVHGVLKSQKVYKQLY